MSIDQAENSRGKRNNGLLVRELDGEVVVLDTESDRIHQLNTTASTVWRMHAKGASAEEIARVLGQERMSNFVGGRQEIARNQ